MITGYIYKISNTKTSDIYVGSTIQELKNRFKSHKSNAKLGKTEKLYEHMREHGIDNFSIKLLEEYKIENKKELGKKEYEYYQKLKPVLNMKQPNIGKLKIVGRVYCMSCTDDEKQFYIGSTEQTLKKRLQDHRSASIKGKTPIYKFMTNKGPENFQISMVEDNIPLDKLIEREDFWIKDMKPTLNTNLFLLRTEQERDKAKYEKNKEKIKARVNKRRIEKREEINAQKKEHYEANKETILAKQRVNKDKNNATRRLRRQKLKESVQISE